MRYATASQAELLDFGIQEIELRQADKETRTRADCEARKAIRAKAIGATIHQANMLCRDAMAFLQRKGVKA